MNRTQYFLGSWALLSSISQLAKESMLLCNFVMHSCHLLFDINGLLLLQQPGFVMHVWFLQSVLGIILGGGAGTRLYPLTKKRAKPAVPLGANYRLIDIPVSNCLNSNISKIYVLTQFNSASLNRHLSRAYASNMGGYKNEGFVEVLAAQQSPENPNWFQVIN